jgi:hypothetical protein
MDHHINQYWRNGSNRARRKRRKGMVCRQLSWCAKDVRAYCLGCRGVLHTRKRQTPVEAE